MIICEGGDVAITLASRIGRVGSTRVNYNREGLLVTGSESTMPSKFIVNNKCTDRLRKSTTTTT